MPWIICWPNTLSVPPEGTAVGSHGKRSPIEQTCRKANRQHSPNTTSSDYVTFFVHKTPPFHADLLLRHINLTVT